VDGRSARSLPRLRDDAVRRVLCDEPAIGELQGASGRPSQDLRPLSRGRWAGHRGAAPMRWERQHRRARSCRRRRRSDLGDCGCALALPLCLLSSQV
jgi:hypothetical protein